VNNSKREILITQKGKATLIIIDSDNSEGET
jgi:hypothetical protein